MPYVTSIERRGRAEGRAEGRIQTLRETILDSLEARFGEVPYELRERIQAIADEAELKRLHRQAALAESMSAFQSKL
jgi:predicted transposase YdaD